MPQLQLSNPGGRSWRFRYDKIRSSVQCMNSGLKKSHPLYVKITRATAILVRTAGSNAPRGSILFNSGLYIPLPHFMASFSLRMMNTVNSCSSIPFLLDPPLKRMRLRDRAGSRQKWTWTGWSPAAKLLPESDGGIAYGIVRCVLAPDSPTRNRTAARRPRKAGDGDRAF